MIFCGDRPDDHGKRIGFLACFFRSLQLAQIHLVQFYKKIAQEDVSKLASQALFPYPRTLGLPDNLCDGSIQYQERIAVNKLVWEATLGGSQVIIKFSTSYSSDCHRLLESKELAPALMHCSQIGDGRWKMIVMKQIRNLKDFANLNPTQAKKVYNKLQDAISYLHEEDYVFGDLREPNILVSEADNGELIVHLIDFDWSGKAGEARYPIQGVNKAGISWPSDVEANGLIKKSHDLYWLQAIRQLLPLPEDGSRCEVGSY
jgi:serine/threonine protein kinase